MSSQNNKTPYPDRPTILRAARAGDESLLGRLTEEDRVLFLLYRDFPLAGEPSLQSAPADWQHKAMAIPEKTVDSSLLHRLAGILTFDSWAGLPAVGTRSTVADERRLRFAADQLTLDVRAEHRRDRWQLTARIEGLEPNSESPTLIADNESVYADTQGFYQWSSPTPPVRISLESSTSLIELAEISWQPNSPK